MAPHPRDPAAEARPQSTAHRVTDFERPINNPTRAGVRTANGQHSVPRVGQHQNVTIAHLARRLPDRLQLAGVDQPGRRISPAVLPVGTDPCPGTGALVGRSVRPHNEQRQVTTRRLRRHRSVIQVGEQPSGLPTLRPRSRTRRPALSRQTQTRESLGAGQREASRGGLGWQGRQRSGGVEGDGVTEAFEFGHEPAGSGLAVATG